MEQPVQVERYGAMVWELPKADALRKTDCLCLRCRFMKPSQPDHCTTASALYDICVRENVACMITRCMSYVDK